MDARRLNFGTFWVTHGDHDIRIIDKREDLRPEPGHYKMGKLVVSIQHNQLQTMLNSNDQLYEVMFLSFQNKEQAHKLEDKYGDLNNPIGYRTKEEIEEILDFVWTILPGKVK